MVVCRVNTILCVVCMYPYARAEPFACAGKRAFAFVCVCVRVCSYRCRLHECVVASKMKPA